MGHFFRQNGDDTRWVYSERGLLSLFFHIILDGHIEPILRFAEDQFGRTLGSAIPNVTGYRLLTEFNLGNNGFGSPDGGLFIRSDRNRYSFIFLEGKRNRFARGYFEPWHEQHLFEHLRLHSYRKTFRLINKFNSSSNGQLELRWRFVNSFLSSNSKTISENNSPPNDWILANDHFYLRYYNDRTSFRTIRKWRSVNLGRELSCLYDQLKLVDQFYLLSVTPDNVYPEKLRELRLYDPQGKPIRERERNVFWMPLDVIRQNLEVWSSGRWLGHYRTT